jgi:flavin reductase (DIM6/NTAB) family NADH-FMN oxidoreductase RutF
MKKISSNLFKLTMSKYATGVTIVTINKDGTYIGKTVNSFASLSLNPPLVLFSLDKKSSSLNDFKKSNFIGINILAKDQKKLSNYFSMKEPDWKDTPYNLSNKKVPLIKNCVVNIHCNKFKLINQGDHVIFICKIDSVDINQKKKPLIYLNSKYI